MDWPKKILLLEDVEFGPEGETIPKGTEGELRNFNNYYFEALRDLDFWVGSGIVPLYDAEHFEEVAWTLPEFAFELDDSDFSGYKFIFTVYYNQPGRIFTSTYEAGEEDEEPYTREPTDDEMKLALSHPLSSQVRVELIAEAGRVWEPWKSISDQILGSALAKNLEPGEA